MKKSSLLAAASAVALLLTVPAYAEQSGVVPAASPEMLREELGELRDLIAKREAAGESETAKVELSLGELREIAAAMETALKVPPAPEEALPAKPAPATPAAKAAPEKQTSVARGWLGKVYLMPSDRTAQPVDAVVARPVNKASVSVNSIEGSGRGKRVMTLDGSLLIQEGGRYAPFVEMTVPASSEGPHYEDCFVKLSIEQAGGMETVLSTELRGNAVSSQGATVLAPATPVDLQPGLYDAQIYTACGNPAYANDSGRRTEFALRIKGPSDVAARPAEVVYEKTQPVAPTKTLSDLGINIVDEPEEKGSQAKKK